MRTTINHVAVVGCGLIGTGWAAHFLMHGRTVTCVDPAEGAEDRLRKGVSAYLAESGASDALRATMLEQLRFDTNLARAVQGADWVQENAPEIKESKIRILQAIDHYAAHDIVIATSTSSLRVSDLQTSLKNPERLVAGHPFHPVPLIGLVEVSGGRDSAASAVDAAMAFYEAVGKKPIKVLKEVAGHIANRLQAALMREAFYLLQEGVASAWDIDLALTEGPGQRWAATGPFISHHLAGGPDGARGTFRNLGAALNSMWADLGAPTLTAELQAQIVDEIDACLRIKPEREWVDSRVRVLRAIQAAKSTSST